MADGDEKEARLVKATFASWKLDVVDALVSDAILQPSDKMVAIYLLQRLNGKTQQLYPSQRLIAEEVHMTARNVRKCLDRLRSNGWLRWARGHTQKANEYEFDDNKIAEEIARMKTDRASRKRRKDAQADRNHSSAQNDDLGGTTVPVVEEPQFRPTPQLNQEGERAEDSVFEADAA